jgi:zinc transport system substrate-binding protein
MRNILLTIGAVFLFISCQTGEESKDKPVISVSIIPQQFFVEELAGELVEVNVLIPPGASPATYEPTVAQLAQLDRSDLYMRIGYIGFEQSWMEKLASANSQMKIVDLSEGVDLILEPGGLEGDHSGHSHDGHVHHGTDPHIWMSAINAHIIAQNIHRELLLLFPAKKQYLEDRLMQFTSTTDSLHLLISQKLEGLENRKFMIYHPALSYYARDYGLEQVPLENEGKSPAPSHIRVITDLALQDQINKILIQSQFDSDNAKILARETGARLIQFDPLDRHWRKQMSYIAEQLNPPRNGQSAD